MSRRLIIRPEAEDDLAEARDWYNTQRENLGTEFLAAIDEVFDRICNAPGLHSPGYKSVRRVAVNRFPYIVYYRLVGDSVEVIAVQHGSRNPRQWRKRT